MEYQDYKNTDRDFDERFKKALNELERLKPPKELCESIESELNRQGVDDLIKSQKNASKKSGYYLKYAVAASLIFLVGYLHLSKYSSGTETVNRYQAITVEETVTPKSSKLPEKEYKITKTNTKSSTQKSKRLNIAGMEKEAMLKLEKQDPYTKEVYLDKLKTMDESISECNNAYTSDFNENIKKSLSMIQDKKLKLIMDILKKN